MPHAPAGRLLRLQDWISSPSGRLATNVAALGAMAAGMLWWTSPHPDASVDERLARLEATNDALRVDNQRLRDELNEVGYKNEILHWQLRYTEQSLRQAQDGLASVEPLPAPPKRRATHRALAGDDGPTEAVVVSIVRVDETDGDDGRADDGDALSEGIARRFRLDDVDVDVPELSADSSLLDRDQALAVWQTVVDDAVLGECGRHLTTAGGYKCRNKVERELWPLKSSALNCMLSGNAVPVYVEDVALESLPNHSQPLARGAVIFCDGSLRNQRR